MVFAFLLFCAAAALYYFAQLDTSYIKKTVAARLEKTVGRKVEIGGELDISFQLPVSVSVRDVRVQNASWGAWPQMMKIKRLECRLRLVPLIFGKVEMKGIVLSGLGIFLETSTSGGWNVAALGVDSRENRTEPEGRSQLPPIDEIRIDRGVLRYRSDRGDERWRLEIEGVTVDIGQKSETMDVKIDGMFQKLPLSVTGSVEPAAALFDSRKKINISAEIGIGENNLDLDGSINRAGSTPVIDADFDLQIDDPSVLSQFVIVPATPVGPIQAAGHLENIGSSRFRVSNLSASMGRNHIAGDLTLETAGETLDIQADLNSSYLDLRDFIRRPEEREKQGRQAPADRSSPRLFSDRPLEPGFLDHSQGSIQLEVEKLVLPFLAMADAKITLELKNGRLILDPMQARIDGGGALSGQLQLTTDKKSLAFEAILRIKHLNLETVLARLGAEKAVTGDVGLELDLNGRGKSIRDIMGGLDGKIVMVVQNGQIAAQYLKNAERLNLDLTDNFLKLFEFTQKKKEFAEINCFVGKFVVKEGLADCRVLVFDTDRVGVLGDGRINLKTEQLHLSLRPIKKSGIGLGGIGKIGADVGALPDNFDVGGTLAHPVISVDKTETAVSTLLTLGKAIGGTLLLGPAGLAAALVDLDIGDENPCITALKEAASEVATAESKKD
jgi:uncharacterized protein involved in outer membrane biogenesis